MTGIREARLRRGAAGAGVATPLRFRILGPLEVVARDGPRPLGGPKQRAVLALLLLHAGEVVPAEALIDALWGDEPPDSSANVIQTYVSLLRRELGGDRILGQAGGYILRMSPDELDVTVFDRLVREARRSLSVEPDLALGTLEDALQLWRGPALVDVADHPRIAAEARRLDEARLDARELRVESMLASGQESRALGEIESVLADDPLREHLWALRMQALYRQGRQADALAAFQRLRRLLRDELGIDPSPELARLHQQVLEQDPMLELRGLPLRGYRLLERLREGPEEIVFRAIQPSVGRDVTVRVISGDRVTSTTFAHDFERRLEVVASLEHPHVAPIHDFWREDGRAYVVSRYLRGGTLQAALERGDPVIPGRSAAIIEQVGSALAQAHAQGISHGQLSAGCIAFDAEGHAYLTDFAITSLDGDQRTDTLELLSLARRLAAADPGLQATLRRLGDDDGELDVDDVVAAVTAALGPAPAPTRVRLHVRDPFKGLRPFGEVDARDFHGREVLTQELIGRLHEPVAGSRFLAIVGPSGAGKSSVVRAGLLPAIRDGALHPAELTFVAELFPGAQPTDELESALRRAAGDAGHPRRGSLPGGDRALLEAAARLLPAGAELVLVIDQLEELFTLTTSEADRARFLELLRVATVDPDSRVRVIVTLRADFYDRPLRYARFGELLARRTEAVAPMAPDELEAAIRRPAEAVGVRLEPGLVSALVADAAQRPGALPLLEFTLTALFEDRIEETLSLATYRGLGGLAGALSSRADEQYVTLRVPAREMTRQVFLRLVTLGEGRDDTRRRVPRSELASLAVDPTAVDEVVEAFGRQRLLTFDHDPVTREPTVEIAHEALLTAWSRLRAWIDGARDDLRHERAVARSAGEWRANDRDPSFLLQGLRLEQAEAWAATTSLAIRRDARSYLKASLDRRDDDRRAEASRREREVALERRSRTRLRALVAVLAVATIIAGTAMFVAVGEAGRATRETRVAQARELAGASVTNLVSDSELAVLLAAQAVETTRRADGTVVPDAETALRRALSRLRAVATIPASGGAVAWGADGTIAVAAQDAGKVGLRDGTSGSTERTVDALDGPITDLAISPDGQWLAIAGADGSIRLRDLRTDGHGILIQRGTGAASGLSFAGDSGRLAATWADERRVRVFEVDSGRLLRSVVLAEPGLTALSPDGGTLIVSTVEAGEQLGMTFQVDSGQRGPRDLVLPGEYDGVAGIAWSPDGESIATVGTLGADLWDAATLGHQAHLRDAPGGSRIAWSPDGIRLAIGDDAGPAVTVVSVDDDPVGDPLVLTALETAEGINDLAFSPDGRTLIAGGRVGQAAKAWALDSRTSSEVLALPTVDRYGDVTFTPDGRSIVAAGDDGRLRTWDLAAGQGSRPFGFAVGEHSFELSPDGATLAMPLFQNGVAAWEIATGRLSFHRTDLGWVDEVAWSPDGRHLIASVHDPEARTVILAHDGTMVTAFADRDGAPLSARFDPTGRFVAAVSSPDAGSAVTLWDWRRATLLRRLPPMPVQMLAFSPDGTSLAGGFGQATIIDVASGMPRVVLDGVTPVISDIAYRPDGTLIATASGDGVVRLFDARSGALLHVLDPGDGRPVVRVAFSPDGSMLATQSPGLVRVWALDVEDVLRIARSRVTRPLSTQECRRFLHLSACPTSEKA